jgi:single-stranded DNA-binding protein
MAITVQFTGFLQEVRHFDWGSVVEIAHTNRKKNQAGEWETVSTDYIDVVIDIAEKEGYRHIFELPKSTRLAVNGRMKFNVYTKQDGTPGAKMKVWAEEIESVGDPVKVIKDVLDPLDAPF